MRGVRRFILRAVVIALPLVFTGFDCNGGYGEVGSALVVASSQTWVHPQGRFTVTTASSPFSFVIQNRSGEVLVESTPLHDAPDPADESRAYAPVGITHNEDLTVQVPEVGWNYYRGIDDAWHHSTTVSSYETTSDALAVHLATDGVHSVTLRFAAQGTGLHMTASIDGAGQDDPTLALNRLSLGFKLHEDDHFMGFGERYVYGDHLGQLLYDWVEDDGFGHGEQTPIGPANPSPSGPGQTHVPIPWFMSPRGFGMLINTTFRTLYHLGDDAADAWRVETWNDPTVHPDQPSFDATLFEDPDPLALVEQLTAITGRPPEIADFVLAPRRRINPGTGESQKLRAAHIPTSVADLDVHYFPNGGGADSAAMKALTADFHTRGFKVVSYFCPFISQDWHPVFDQAAAAGYLVKRADGTPYTVIDPPYVAGMVDFTNPDAVAWYQGWMQQALDDGWDGWMYDFAEYVPIDAVMSNGMSGGEAHNLYPLLYQKAAFDLLERQMKKNYLIFARSGYAGPAPGVGFGANGGAPVTYGTGGLTPMVWAGDQATDFDLADGLPAALTGALNVGMSGVPLWGSDISGYHFIYNPPPDKEVYLRWTEVGAFSADMHDENEGAGSSPYTGADRWQIWKDQESQDVYRKYATYKTRMIPYVRLAVKQARDRGTPVMRHLYLSYPQDTRVYTITDEYMYGDALLVAPVVARGLTSRSVYLPEAAYFDFWSGARVVGGGDVMAPAPLDVVPVYAKLGAIVPMLSADVETVFPSSDGSVVSAADRADFLEVAVFAGGQSSVTLDDGTVLAQSAPTDPFAPASPTHAAGAIPPAANAADLLTCDACAWDDPASHVWSVAVKTQADAITAGPLVLTVSGAPTVKRFLFTVRH